MEYINETKSQILKRKLLESIKIIKENLYDANGNLRIKISVLDFCRIMMKN